MRTLTEPWDLDWGEGASPGVLPRIEPRTPELMRLAHEAHGAREAMVHDGERVTYADIEARSARLARQLLAAGVAKGTRVGLLLPDDPRFLVSWFAVTRIGAVAVALSTLVTPAELTRIARHADLDTIIAVPGFLRHDYAGILREAFPGMAEQSPPYRLSTAPFLRRVWFWPGGQPLPGWATAIDPAAEPDAGPDRLAAAEVETVASDPCGIIHTSGLTAEPKGVIHSHGSLVRQGMKLAVSFGCAADERIFSTLPFFWVGGLATTMLCAFSIGATIIGGSQKGGELVDLLERERVTAVISRPHILRGIAEDPGFVSRDWSAMRGGLLYEALPPHLRAPDPALMPTPLGMTETAGPYTRLVRCLPERHRGAIGPLLPGIEGRLVDPGSGEALAEWRDGDRNADSGGAIGVMQLRGDTMMMGMVKREGWRVFTADGWYHTGDLCSFAGGHLHFHGRADDLIKASGANVSPAEVELAIGGVEGAASAIVLGVPDAGRGSVVGAVVMPQPGASLTVERIRAETARLLSSYKRPRAILVMDAADVPMLPSRKVDRLALIAMLAGTLG